MTVGELIQFLNKFPSDRAPAVKCHDGQIREIVALHDGSRPVFMVAQAKPKEEKKPERPDTDDVIEQCDRILGLLDDIPDAGEDFAESVSEKVESIREWAESGKPVTEKQQEALDNMERGANRWVNGD